MVQQINVNKNNEETFKTGPQNLFMLYFRASFWCFNIFSQLLFCFVFYCGRQSSECVFLSHSNTSVQKIYQNQWSVDFISVHFYTSRHHKSFQIPIYNIGLKIYNIILASSSIGSPGGAVSLLISNRP